MSRTLIVATTLTNRPIGVFADNAAFDAFTAQQRLKRQEAFAAWATARREADEAWLKANPPTPAFNETRPRFPEGVNRKSAPPELLAAVKAFHERRLAHEAARNNWDRARNDAMRIWQLAHPDPPLEPTYFTRTVPFYTTEDLQVPVVSPEEELSRLIADMDVPEQRRTDVGWLSRNLMFRNGQHPNYARVVELLRRLRKD